MNTLRPNAANRSQSLAIVAAVTVGWLAACGGDPTSSSDDADGGVPTTTPSAATAPPPPGCTDGAKSGSESDVDCGGSCAKCADAKSCAGAGDCESGICTDRVCEPNECAPDPCLNGGTCTDGKGSFTCACIPGFTGATCQTNIDECAPNPCLNGGACTDGVKSYTCACAPGFTGATCQTNIDECAPNPCLNGGTCTDGINSFTCACPVDYGGATCSTSPASCLAIKTQKPASVDGVHWIDPDGDGGVPALQVDCDMTTDGGGYTMYAVTGGISTTRFDQPNSCTAVGLQMAVPRTRAHLGALFAKYGGTYFATVPGVYGIAAGDFSDCAMNSSDAKCGANWRAVGGGAWFAKSVPYTEPGGDYVPGCWLGNLSINLGVTGLLGFNDANCSFSTGPLYVCSDNAK